MSQSSVLFIPRSSTLKNLLHLSRAKMTTISAVTYLAASSIPQTPFNLSLFFRGYLFILSTQITTHFLGEIYDLPSDKLNIHATPLTGGSRVLTTAPEYLSLTRRAAFAAFCFSAFLIAFALPSRAAPVACIILALAVSYSAPPLKLNHRAMGELGAAYITSVLVPYFGATVQGALSGHFPFYHHSLAFLVIPPTLVKFSLFLLLNLADRRCDWAAGKVTLAVQLGDLASARLYAACMAAAYIAAIVISALGDGWDRFGALFVIPSLWWGGPIAWELLIHVPYRLDSLLGPSLLHSTIMVCGVLMHALVGGRAGLSQIAITAVFMGITVWNVRKGKGRGKKVFEEPVQKLDGPTAAAKLNNPRGRAVRHMGAAASKPGVKSISQVDAQGEPFSAPDEVAAEKVWNSDVRKDVVIVGGGAAGLVAAATLSKMGRSVLVLERRASSKEAESGADVALWPGAIAVLKALGVENGFFKKDCFPLETVYMCNMDFSAIEERGSATVLKVIDMAKVTKGTGEKFVLTPRQQLMDAIRKAVGEGLVVYGVDVVGVEEDEANDCVYTSFFATRSNSREHDGNLTMHCVKSRVVIGADGAHSRLRAHVSPKHGGADAVRFCGEVCYRGVLKLGKRGGRAESDDNIGGVPNEVREWVTKLIPDRPEDGTMRINYGAGLRSSFGYMSADGEVGFWWVKERSERMPRKRGKLESCAWPEPLKTLHDVTAESGFYMHAIEDSASLPKWSTPRVVLIGDAAHVVTPNMGQGACLATEDAFVLGTELVKQWSKADGHLEAFYNYERCRRPYAAAVAAESRKQLFLGQLQSKAGVYLRELLLWIVPAGVLEKSLRRNNFPVQKYVEEFGEAVRRART